MKKNYVHLNLGKDVFLKYYSNIYKVKIQSKPLWVDVFTPLSARDRHCVENDSSVSMLEDLY